MDKKISQLTAATTPLAGTETLPIVQGGSTVKATVQDVLGYVVNDSTNSVLKTVYSASDIGLNLDFVNSLYQLGDYINSTAAFVVEASDCIVGDWNGNLNSTKLFVTDIQSLIKTQYQGNDTGLKLDFANGSYNLGDHGITNTGTYISVDDANSTIKTYFSTNEIGLKFNYSSSQYYFGDWASVFNGTYILIDDANQRFELSNNLTEATAGGSASKYLKVYINGVTYKLALLNNA